MTPYQRLAVVVAEQRTEINRLRGELDMLRCDAEKWPTRVESASSLRAYRKATIEECAQLVDTWRRGYGLKYLAEKIRALARN